MSGGHPLPPELPPDPAQAIVIGLQEQAYGQLLRAEIRLADARRRLADAVRIALVVTAALVDAGVVGYLVKHLP